MRLAQHLCLLLVVCGGAIAEACEYPPLVVIPEKEDIGDQVADVLRDMRRYADGMAEYVACVQAEIISAGGDDAPALQKALLIQRNNAAVYEAKVVAELFTERVGSIENLRVAEFIDTERVSCVPMNRIESTAVVDDRVVLFFQRGDGAYLNVLESACLGLERNRFFTYESPSHPVDGLAEVGMRDRAPVLTRLCHTSSIYVVEPDLDALSSERRPGYPCALGWFFPISDAQAAVLLEPRGDRADILVVPVEPREDTGSEPE